MKRGAPKILSIALSFATMVLAACSASFEVSPPDYNPQPPKDEKRYLDISLDGKVGYRSETGSLAAVPGLKVTMINADGIRTDSARTNSNGRFLIEHRQVAVGYYWEKHIYIEVSDDRPDTEEETRYETLRILKQIDASPNNTAILTMDEIVVTKVGRPKQTTLSNGI